MTSKTCCSGRSATSRARMSGPCSRSKPSPASCSTIAGRAVSGCASWRKSVFAKKEPAVYRSIDLKCSPSTQRSASATPRDERRSDRVRAAEPSRRVCPSGAPHPRCDTSGSRSRIAAKNHRRCCDGEKWRRAARSAGAMRRFVHGRRRRDRTARSRKDRIREELGQGHRRAASRASARPG